MARLLLSYADRSRRSGVSLAAEPSQRFRAERAPQKHSIWNPRHGGRSRREHTRPNEHRNLSAPGRKASNQTTESSRGIPKQILRRDAEIRSGKTSRG